MYLYVFVFIILSVMAVYMELFSLRVAQINEQQTTPATVMYDFHNGAYKYTKLKYDSGNSSSPCSISYSNAVTGTSRCKDKNNADVYLNVIQDVSGVYLPLDFKWTFIRDQFSSYVIKPSAGGSILVTFVMNDGSRPMGITPSQMMQQIVRLSYPINSYGTVENLTCAGTAGRRLKTNVFYTKAGGDAVKPCFDMPSTVTIGSVGLVSYIQ